MNDSKRAGLRLEYSGDQPDETGLEVINEVLAPFGSRIWSLDLRSVPTDIRQLLDTPELNDAESRQVMDYFMLPRAQLTARFEEAGRTLQVPGGGEMSTLDMTHNIRYPELYIVNPGVDFSRFDRFHVNTGEDGIGVDEMMFVLVGSGVRLLQHLPDAGLVTLHIDCPGKDHGWYVTYNGSYPHIGSISGCAPGTKVLMQVIGVPQWHMRYEDEAQ